MSEFTIAEHYDGSKDKLTIAAVGEKYHVLSDELNECWFVDEILICGMGADISDGTLTCARWSIEGPCENTLLVECAEWYTRPEERNRD